MSERPTPETDKIITDWMQGVTKELPSFVETARKLERERDEARELIKAYQEYTKLLGDEINDMTAVAYVHGWKTNRYEQGRVLREKIKQLESEK